MPKYKLIICDFDGTLFATHEAILYCISKTFEKYKVALPARDAIYHTITQGIGLEDTFKILNTSLQFTDKKSEEKANLLQWIESYRDIYNKEGESKAAPFDGATIILEYFKKLNIPVVVISNKGVEAINSALKYYKLEKFITLTIGDIKGLKKKPDPMIFNQIIRPQFSDISLSEILVIGDTPADIMFAKNIGADVCWAKYGYGNPDECKKLGPTYSIESLSNLNIMLESPQFLYP